MSIYHYVKSKDELLDLVGDRIIGGQLVDDAELRRGWREGLTAIAQATRRNFERHPWMGGAMSPRPTTIPRPNAIRHIDQSLAAVADVGLDVAAQMEIIGFAIRSQRVAESEEEMGGDAAEWMRTMLDLLRERVESGDYPDLLRAVQANRAAGGPDEDLGRMASGEARLERRLDLLLDGIEAALARRAKPVRRRRGR
jgi:AcrR family transcriptional regulator